jgi:hypothetical protein
MHDHKCGCVTSWDDDLGHPVYLKACGVHRRQVPDGWMLAPKKAPKRIKASA